MELAAGEVAGRLLNLAILGTFFRGRLWLSVISLPLECHAYAFSGEVEGGYREELELCSYSKDFRGEVA